MPEAPPSMALLAAASDIPAVTIRIRTSGMRRFSGWSGDQFGGARILPYQRKAAIRFEVPPEAHAKQAVIVDDEQPDGLRHHSRPPLHTGFMLAIKHAPSAAGT